MTEEIGFAYPRFAPHFCSFWCMISRTQNLSLSFMQNYCRRAYMQPANDANEGGLGEK